MRNGTLPKDKKEKKKDKKHKDKKDKKRKRHEDREEMDDGERDHRRSRSPARRNYRDGSDETDYDERSRRRSRSPYRRGHPEDRDNRKYGERDYRHSRSPVEPRHRRHDSRSPPRLTYRDEYKKPRTQSPKPSTAGGYSASAEDRAARLAAMSTNASVLTVDRKERLTNLLVEEKLELEAEDQRRANGKSSFLFEEQKKLLSGSGGIEETFRRGRKGYNIDKD